MRSVEDEERVRNNPRITLATPTRCAASATTSTPSRRRRAGQRHGSCGEQSLDAVSIQGVSRDYLYFSTFDAERGRLISQTEIDRNRPVTVLGWEVADKLFGGRDPLDRTIKISGVHFRVVGVSEKKGSIFGQSQDEFAIIPLGTFCKMFGSRPGMQLLVKPRTPNWCSRRWTTRRWRCGSSGGCGRGADNFGMFTSTRCSASLGDGRPVRGAHRRRRAVARRRRHRHHEHHADGGQRAHARNRPAQGARRTPPRHHLADPHRIGDAVDDGRVVGVGLGFIAALIVSKLTPLPAAVQSGRWASASASPRRRPVLRALSGDARGALDPIDALRRE